MPQYCIHAVYKSHTLFGRWSSILKIIDCKKISLSSKWYVKKLNCCLMMFFLPFVKFKCILVKQPTTVVLLSHLSSCVTTCHRLNSLYSEKSFGFATFHQNLFIKCVCVFPYWHWIYDTNTGLLSDICYLLNIFSIFSDILQLENKLAVNMVHFKC